MVAPATSPALHFRGRGVYFFAGRVRCPLAGIGERADDASNRLVLENSDTEVTIDRAAGRITVLDERAYTDRKIVADLLFLAEGQTVTGEREDLCIHLKVMKHGHRYAIDLHLHRHYKKTARLASAVYEPFEVVVSDRGRTEVVVDPKRIDKLLTKPPLALRVVKALITVRDHNEGEPDYRKVGYRFADFSIGFGVLGLDHLMARIQMISLDAEKNAPLIEGASISEMIRHGTWELNMISQSDKWLPEVVQRDIFLYGIDEVPMLHEIRAHGLRKGMNLGFRFAQGYGEIVVNGMVAPMPRTLDIARSYIEFHVNGGLLAERASRGPRPLPRS